MRHASTPRDGLDSLTLEVMRRHLISSVAEMVRTTTRTAYSTVFSEALDFSCALFDEDGRMIAQAAGLPVHVGALGDALQDMFRYYDSFERGDVIIHNDPYAGGTHQADVAVIRPMFHEGAQLGFAVNRGHWADIGGMTAGGWGGGARHVIQEAITIPPTKLYRKGEVIREIRDFVLRNVRMPAQAWGDLQAQIASAITAERRVVDLAERYGVDAVREAGRRAITYSGDRFRRQMAVIPDGRYEAQDIMDDDGFGGDPRTLSISVVKQGTSLTVDFEGTSAQVAGSINATLAATKAAVHTALINIIDPEIPINAGSLEAVEIKAPLGSLVNPTYPAPCFAGLADTTARSYETIFKALADAVPERVAAGSYASGTCTTGWGFVGGNEFVWYAFGPGGCGARAWGDGNSAEWNAMGSCKNESAEVWENRYPVRVRELAFVPDSAGAGRWRGGLGQVKALQLLEDTYVSASIDHMIGLPFGLQDGETGTNNAITLDEDGVERDFPTRFGTQSLGKFSNLLAPAGSTLRIYAGGGGGFGPVSERPRELVEADIRGGYISQDAARERYGFEPGDPAQHEKGQS
ncbi:MAG TPA: hydantoinase B/oxoprolinase family protein [Solirubrobacteraceae bacterium]|jgi:N-methylhydantoinase B/oxoprolinase/acetone carboxylase alpha subunit